MIPEVMIATTNSETQYTHQSDCLVTCAGQDGLCLEVRSHLVSSGVRVWQQKTDIPKDSENCKCCHKRASQCPLPGRRKAVWNARAQSA